MFPHRYFTGHHFPPRYFPPSAVSINIVNSTLAYLQPKGYRMSVVSGNNKVEYKQPRGYRFIEKDGQ